MKAYTKEFTRALERVEQLRTNLEKAERALQDECPHVRLDGTSTFPRGTSFVDCTLCGLSNHDLGRKRVS